MLDLIVILVILIYAFNGWRRGLILSVFSILGYILSLIVAREFSPVFTKYVVLNTGFDTWLDSILSVTQMNVPTSAVSDLATNTIINVICFFIIFAVTSMVIFNIARLVNGVGRLPVIGELNSLGGLVFGTVKGLLLIFIVLALSQIIVTTGNTQLGQKIEGTIVVKSMYHNNPILYVIKEIVPPEFQNNKFL